MVTQLDNREWAFLLHRLPRLPSAPRIGLWRSLRRLGALLVADGLVALPASPRTIEHLEWLAAGIHENGGEASVWVAKPTTRRTTERLVVQGREAVEGEYRAVIREATDLASLDSADGHRAVRRLRRQLHAIAARDFFDAPSRQRARTAVDALARDKVPA